MFGFLNHNKKNKKLKKKMKRLEKNVDWMSDKISALNKQCDETDKLFKEAMGDHKPS